MKISLEELVDTLPKFPVVRVTEEAAEYYEKYEKQCREDGKQWEGFPVRRSTIAIFLGEMAGQPGHCILAVDGRIHVGWHTDSFELVPEEEL